MNRRVLFDGEWPKEAPDQIYCYCNCACGQKLYLLGLKTTFSTDPSTSSIVLTQIPTFVELYPVTGQVTSFAVDEEIAGNVVDIYTLSGENVIGVLLACKEQTQLVQQIWRLNRKRLAVNVVVERRVKFAGLENLRLGIGTSENGYLFLLGHTALEDGANSLGLLLPANPLASPAMPDVVLDRELADLEGLCRSQPDGLCLFPNCVPLVSNSSLFFLLAREAHGTLVFECNLIAVVELQSRRIHLLAVDGSEAQRRLTARVGRPVNIGYCSNVTQRGSFAWMSFIVPQPDGHWRYKLQRAALWLCHCWTRFVLRPLVWFSFVDGGRLCLLAARLYFHMLGPSLVPQLGPPPDLVIMALDLNQRRFKFIPFETTDPVLRSNTSAFMVDCVADGSLTVAEAAPEHGRLRITRTANPFRVPRLIEVAFATCEQLFPGYRRHAGLRRLGVREVRGGGCPVFVLD